MSKINVSLPTKVASEFEGWGGWGRTLGQNSNFRVFDWLHSMVQLSIQTKILAEQNARPHLSASEASLKSMTSFSPLTATWVFLKNKPLKYIYFFTNSINAYFHHLCVTSELQKSRVNSFAAQSTNHYCIKANFSKKPAKKFFSPRAEKI